MDQDLIASGHTTPCSTFGFSTGMVSLVTTPAQSPRVSHSTALYQSLPLALGIPEGLSPVDPDQLEMDPELEDIPTEYIVEQIQKVSASIFANPGELDLPEKGSAIPTFMSYRQNCAAPAEPTHILAFISEDAKTVQYCLTFGLLYALLSKKLSHLSYNKASEYLRSAGSDLLPVEQIRIGNGCHDTLYLLHHFAHHNSPTDLLSMLLPASKGIYDVVHSQELAEYGSRLIESVSELDNSIITTHLDQIVRFRNLLISLEIGDAKLWTSVQTAWTILSLSLRRRLVDSLRQV